MRFKVYWNETVCNEVEIEATSEEEARTLILEGKYDKDETEWYTEFANITKVVEVG